MEITVEALKAQRARYEAAQKDLEAQYQRLAGAIAALDELIAGTEAEPAETVAE